MDALSIGLEFVRQYYQLLHSNPSQLHRFYLDNSKYVHAGENGAGAPAVGQQAIYECINGLNFSDCRTRIRQVDSQESLHQSCIIQVVGEISNASQPMRPFVQTLVLAQSAENKFYVSNDVFRYQDHIVAAEVEPMINVPVVMMPTSEPLANGQVADYFGSGSDNHAHLNGNVAVDSTEPTDAPEPLPEVPVCQPEPVQPPAPEPVEEEEPAVQVPVAEPKSEPAKSVFSWASVASSSSASSGQGKKAPAPAVVRAPEPVKPAAAPAAGVPAQNSARPRRANGAPNGTNPGSQVNPMRNQSSRQNGGVPDNQQIFVGGLNPTMTEDEIKGVFTSFGNAIDIKMTPKQFCFVSFESAQIVENILAQTKSQAFYLGNQRLNVEEKKERSSGNRVPGNRQNGSAPSTGGRGRAANGSFSRTGANGSRGGRDAAAAGHRR